MCRRIPMRTEKNSTRVSFAPGISLQHLVKMKKINQQFSRLVHRFDGEPLDSNKTADEQELEGGEIIDMFVTS